MDPHTTVIIPLDDRVIFVSLLNCAEFSSRLSEVAQTLDAISGNQFLASAAGSESGGLLARSESGIAPACDKGGWGALRSLGVALLVRWVTAFFHVAGGSHFRTTVHRLDRYSIGMERMVRPVQTAQF